MKIVLKISSSTVASEEGIECLGEVISELRGEGHRIIVIHKGNPSSLPVGEAETEAAMRSLCALNKALAARLTRAGNPAFGLCGSDAAMVRLRKSAAALNPAMAVASVDSFWLDTLSKSGGVPVMANLALGPDQKFYACNTDELAAACAVACEADALILLSRYEGLLDGNGGVERWVSPQRVEQLMKESRVQPGMLSKLKACRYALEHGVRRARVLPLSQMSSLSLFYVSRNDFGTEVSMTA